MARPTRALIIACENYPQDADVMPKLEGTLDAARNFYNWLVAHKRAAVGDIYICCNDVLVADHPADRTFKGNRGDIVRAIVALCDTGRDNTGELFMFFSGHGVGYEISPQQRGLDVLLASDYVNRRFSGAACIKLDELRSELRKWLGGTDHYYFLDACRTVYKVGEIQPAELGLALPLAADEEPTTYVLYSTKFGETSKINSGFADALVDGLKGTGRAKLKRGRDWFVQFERVQKFVQSRVKGKTDVVKDGGRDGLILALDPPSTTLTVAVDDAAATDQCTLTVELDDGFKMQPLEFTGGSFQHALPPNDAGYTLTLARNQMPLIRAEPGPNAIIDLFDPITVRFKPAPMTRSRMFPESRPASSQAGLQLPDIRAHNLLVRVRNTSTGKVEERSTPAKAMWMPLAPGTYSAELVQGNRVERSMNVTLKPGERKEIDLLGQPKDRVQRGISARLPTRDDLPDASESLRGPLIDQDTSMWLTIVGASRLIGSPADFSKLGPWPLATFDDLTQGDSVVYALAGLQSGDRASIAVSSDAAVHWEAMKEVPTLDGVFEFRSRRQPGPVLISFAVPGMPAITYASYALPNRAAFIVFDVTSSGQVVTRQLLLPVYPLQRFLDNKVYQRFEEERLRLIRYLTIAQTVFASRGSLEPVTTADTERWNELLLGKWIDPLLALMAIFDAARRGRAQGVEPKMAEAFANLDQYFGELPDVEAARRVLGAPSRPVAGAPLLLESLERTPEMKKALPLPSQYLDYGSMWTSWWGAVSAPE